MGIFSPSKSPHPEIPHIKLGVIGVSGSGKTYILTAIKHLLCGRLDMDNELWFGAANGDTTKKYLTEYEGAVVVMKSGVIPSTPVSYDFDCHIHHQLQSVLKLTYHDIVGQIMTNLTNTKEFKEEHKKFLRNVSMCNVLWILLPVPVDEDGKYVGINGIKKDIVLARAYVQDALKERSPEKPLAVAFVITKIDVLTDDLESGEGKKVMDAIASELEQQFAFFVKSSLVSSAVLLPVSALGFDNAILMPNQDDKARSRFYILKNDEPEPYNVDKVLLWSIASAVYQTNLPVDQYVKQGLVNNLQKMKGLLYLLKQEI